MSGLRLPQDPQARSAILQRQQQIERQGAAEEQARAARQEVRLAQIQALARDVTAWSVMDRAVAALMAEEQARIVGTPETADLFRAQGALRALSSLRKVLDEAKGLPQPPRA